MEVGGSAGLGVWVRCPGAAGVGGDGAEVDPRLGESRLGRTRRRPPCVNAPRLLSAW